VCLSPFGIQHPETSRSDRFAIYDQITRGDLKRQFARQTVCTPFELVDHSRDFCEFSILLDES
jgi:hypothetical protein